MFIESFLWEVYNNVQLSEGHYNKVIIAMYRETHHKRHRQVYEQQRKQPFDITRTLIYTQMKPQVTLPTIYLESTENSGGTEESSSSNGTSGGSGTSHGSRSNRGDSDSGWDTVDGGNS